MSDDQDNVLQLFQQQVRTPLIRAGLVTRSQIAQTRDDQLELLRGMGPKGIAEIRAVVPFELSAEPSIEARLQRLLRLSESLSFELRDLLYDVQDSRRTP